ncbi:hypothetical protein ACVXG9_18345 [Escherichia coli]
MADGTPARRLVLREITAPALDSERVAGSVSTQPIGMALYLFTARLQNVPRIEIFRELPLRR